MKHFRSVWLANSLLLACIAIPETESVFVSAGGRGGGGAGGTSGAQNGGSTANVSGDTSTGGDDSSSGGSAAGGTGGSAASAGSAGSAGSAAGGTGATGGDGTGANGGEAGSGGSGGNVAGHPDPDFEYPTHTGFTLALVEEFDDPLDLVSDPIWTYGDGGPPEGNTRYVKDAISFSGGALNIEVRQENIVLSYSYALDVTIGAKPLASGELRTRFNNYRYGRYEARMKAPYPNAAHINGNFIQEFLVSRQPQAQEWRVVRTSLVGEGEGVFHTNVEYANNQATWTAQLQEFVSSYPSGVGTSPLPSGFYSRAAYHVYAFEWTPTQIRWYVDDTLVRIKDPDVGANNLPIPDESTKILLNIWVFAGSAYGGDPSTNEYPFTASFDWFRFYRLDSEATYPCTPTPGCLPSADLDLARNNFEDGL